MNRNDNSKYFLFIEPDINTKSDEPLNDIYTEAIEYAMSLAISGTSNYSNINCNGDSFQAGSGYRGFHTFDGEASSCDYLLPNGFITNAIASHYVRWFRSSITGQNLDKLYELGEWYKNVKNKNDE